MNLTVPSLRTVRSAVRTWINRPLSSVRSGPASPTQLANALARSCWYSPILVGLGLSLLPCTTAAPVFSYSISSSDGGAPLPYTLTFNSLSSALEALHNELTDPSILAFDPFSTQETATLFGYQNALILVDTGTFLSLTSPVTSLNRTFTGPTATQDYEIYTDSDQALEDLTNLIKALTKLSPVVNVDGTPTAGTAASAQTVFEQFGFDRVFASQDLGADAGAESDAPGTLSLGFYADQSKFEVDAPGGGTFDGSNSKFSMPLGRSFNSHVALRAGFTLEYTKIEDTEMFGGSAYLGLPIKLVRFKPVPDSLWQLQLTPFGGFIAQGARDGSAGSASSFFGGTVVLEYKINPNLIISGASQWSSYESSQWLEDNYDYAIPVSQKITKNGLRVRWRFTGRWIAEGYVLDTRFLEDAVIDHFQTVGGGLSFKLTDRCWVGLNAKYEFGDGYKGYNIGASSGWTF